MLTSEIFGYEKFDTIFFGGGTPSVLSAFEFGDIINNLYRHFNLSNDAEISIEANPEDFISKDISDYRAAGINRISFGVQSFLDDELKFLTRQHTAGQAEEVITKARSSFDNINVDIIYSLPSQKIDEVGYSLTRAIELEVQHISTYTLTYEERTLLYKTFLKNPAMKNPDSIEAALYESVSEILAKAGYEHYEVSNFAKPGFRCRHNLKYWERKNYLGLGPSSHSLFDNLRWNNYRDIIKYNSMLEKNGLPVEEKLSLTDSQKKLEHIMLALRSTGIVFNNYRDIFNEDFEKKYSQSIKQLVDEKFADVTDSIFILNDKGYAVADEIVAKYF